MPDLNGESADDAGEERDDGPGEQRRRPVKIERDELEQRLVRTLGCVVKLNIEDRSANHTDGMVEQEEDGERAQEGATRGIRRDDSERRAPRRSGRRRGGDEADDE